MQSGGAPGGQAETTKSKQKYPLASRSFKIEGMRGKTVQSRGIPGGQAETVKSKQEYPLASILVKSEGMQENEFGWMSSGCPSQNV